MREIEGFQGYFVTECGKVFSKKRGYLIEMTQQENIDGYWVVNLYIGKKSFHKRVNRLVAEAFVENPNPEEFDVVHHKDDDRKNNKANNLEWCTVEQNNRYKVERGRHAFGEGSGRAVLSENTVLEVYDRLLQGEPLKIASEYGIDERTVLRIKAKESWFHILKDLPDIEVRANRKRLSEAEVRQVCEMLQKGLSQTEIAEEVGTSKQVVWKIQHRKSFTSISKHYNF